MTEISVFFILMFIIAIVAIEYYCRTGWVKSYFYFGIPCFFMNLKFENGERLNFPIDILNDTFRGITHFLSPISFKEINENSCAFQEKEYLLLSNLFSPIMRGLIRYNPSKKSMTIIGRLNWFPFSLFILGIPGFMVFFVKQLHIGILIGPIIFFLLLIIIQSVRYAIVGIKCRSILKSKLKLGYLRTLG